MTWRARLTAVFCRVFLRLLLAFAVLWLFLVTVLVTINLPLSGFCLLELLPQDIRAIYGDSVIYKIVFTARGAEYVFVLAHRLPLATSVCRAEVAACDERRTC